MANAKNITKIIVGEDLYYLKDKQVRDSIGANNGIATLDSSGKVPSSQLPSYVDDVIDAYYYNNTMYEDLEHTTAITPETGKIYVDLHTNESYRWSGTTYIVLSSPYVLPTASSNVLGGIKVGDGLSIDNNGVLSAEGQEVEIGHTTPTECAKLFVDEDADPAVSLDVYTRAQVDAKIADTVHLSAQTLTEAQKAQARDNIGSISQIQLDALTRYTRKTDFDLNVLKQAVADGNLEKYGLKVGDQKTITNGDRAYTYVIAELNPMKGTISDYTVTTNHVGLVVLTHTIQKWNASGNTYTGADSRGAGYMNSDLHYYLKNTVLPNVKIDLGSNNLVSHGKLLSNNVNTNGYNKLGSPSGCSSSWGLEQNCYISALSECQIYGAAICSSSLYDTGEACKQLLVFLKYKHTEIFDSELVWLRDVVSVSDAAYADNYGRADGNPALYDSYVAALILFK